MEQKIFNELCKTGFALFKGPRRKALETGARMGLTPADVGTIRKMAGFSNVAYNKTLSKKSRLEVVRRRKNGASFSSLAERYGVTRTAIFNICRGEK